MALFFLLAIWLPSKFSDSNLWCLFKLNGRVASFQATTLNRSVSNEEGNGNTVDGRNPAPPTKCRNWHSPGNTKQQRCSMASCKMDFVHPQYAIVRFFSASSPGSAGALWELAHLLLRPTPRVGFVFPSGDAWKPTVFGNSLGKPRCLYSLATVFGDSFQGKP